MESVLADRAPRLRRPARLLRLTSDERLVALVRDGDEGAFEVLYDRHHAAILGFCRHMLGTREEAEDAVQHTFLAAFRDLTRSDKPIDLQPWLFAIARNRCLSLLRARRAHVAIELADPATDGLTATVERREDLRELLVDLAGLPEDQRAALLLAELGALDHAGIAAVLGCPREKVKALVFQARTSLAASREARATPCDEIRLELATASGAALRRGPLRRHLRTCEGCRAFRSEVAAQRRLMALALPVVPTLALKASVLAGSGAAASGGATAAATAAGAGATSGSLGGVLGALASTGAGKAAASLAVAGAIAGGALTTVKLEHRDQRHTGSVSSRATAPHDDSAQPVGVGVPAHHDTSRPSRPQPHRPSHVERADSSPVTPPHRVAPSHTPAPAPAAPPAPGGLGTDPVPAPAPAPAPDPAPAPAPGSGDEGGHEGTPPPARGTVPPGHEKDENPPGQGHDDDKSSHGHGKSPKKSHDDDGDSAHDNGD